MKKSLELFQKIVQNLLEDEATHPVAEFVPSATLFERMDLGLNEHPISEEDLEDVLQDLVFKAPRTATNAFF